jgi:uncharacterized protein (TIGR04141 family)
MTKTRSFSIFLLKEGFDATNALKEDNTLHTDVIGDNLPEGAVLFVLDNPPHPPWWKSYFGLQKDLSQVSKGALVFVPAQGRWFALSFGHVFHNLSDTSYEYDFGLRVTLNCVDPEKLKSTDILEPSGAKRQRTQLPVDSDLTFFDFDRDSTILKSLTGKVKAQYKELFKHATGASNIRVSSDATSAGLADLCGVLLDLYQDDAYKTAFPDIQNISPVRDPVVIEHLNLKLIEALRTKDDALSLSVPEIQNYGDGLWGTFSGAGGGKVYDDIFIARYYEYLAEAPVELDAVGLPELKRHNLVLTDEDGSSARDRFTIFKCLIFDTTIDDGKRTFHLCEGNWYLIDTDYVTKLTTYLDPLCKDTTLPNFAHANEGDYNEKASEASETRVCLDKTSVAPQGQKQVEPCDIYELADGKAVLHHIKISTLSGQLSHLFNQGTNSVKLLRADDEAMGKLEALVSAKVGDAKADEFVAPLKTDQIKVAFGIITHKDKTGISLNLPLFSRISLMRCMKELKVMGIEAEFGFIADESPKNDGKKKKRKPKGGAAE